MATRRCPNLAPAPTKVPAKNATRRLLTGTYVLILWIQAAHPARVRAWAAPYLARLGPSRYPGPRPAAPRDVPGSEPAQDTPAPLSLPSGSLASRRQGVEKRTTLGHRLPTGTRSPFAKPAKG